MDIMATLEHVHGDAATDYKCKWGAVNCIFRGARLTHIINIHIILKTIIWNSRPEVSNLIHKGSMWVQVLDLINT